MAGHKIDAFRILRIRALQNRVDIRQRCGRRHACGYWLDKEIGLHLQTSGTCLGVALEFLLDPLGRGSYPETLRDHLLIVGGERVAVLEGDQLFDRSLDALGGIAAVIARRNVFGEGNRVRDFARNAIEARRQPVPVQHRDEAGMKRRDTAGIEWNLFARLVACPENDRVTAKVENQRKGAPRLGILSV